MMSEQFVNERLQVAERALEAQEKAVAELRATVEGLVSSVGILQMKLEGKFVEDDEPTQPGVAPPVPFGYDDLPDCKLTTLSPDEKTRVDKSDYPG